MSGLLRSFGLTSTRCAHGAALALAVVVLGGCLAPDQAADDTLTRQQSPGTAAAADDAAAQRTAAPASPSVSAGPPTTSGPSRAPTSAPAVTKPSPTRAAAPPLLIMAAGGDGDSWRDRTGTEYRMGLINTPETNECGGPAATAYRKRVLAAGFRATVYATDGYSRRVSVILTADGVNLNVAMARDGIADDRYLQRFRHENPTLAAQLDAAFRDARAAGRGIWTACAASAPAPAPDTAPAPAPAPTPADGCHPDYRTCIPVRGDGSGRGAANDLDCGEIDQTVHLRQVGRDPYRLDGSDQDGIGCE